MRFARLSAALLVLSLVTSVVATGPFARAQSPGQAQDEADAAQRRVEAASGLVDEAVANRDEIEGELADSITRMNELADELSRVGSDLDRVASQVGYADVELAGIQSDIENQAIDAYMTVVASPSASLVNTSSVEMALVASSVVDDVVADGRLTVAELFARRKGLEELKKTYLAEQDEYKSLKDAMESEVEHYTALYEEAEADVAAAIQEAQAANQAYLDALSAVELAKAKDDERQRQENRERQTTSTSSTTAPPNETTTTSPKSPGTTSGGNHDWHHPPQVERWRDLVAAYFPASRVDEALAIIDCESNGDPDALNPYSGAGGLFQFLPSTWKTTSPKAGFPDSSVFDAEANIGTAAWLADRYQELGKPYWSPWSCRRVLN